MKAWVVRGTGAPCGASTSPSGRARRCRASRSTSSVSGSGGPASAPWLEASKLRPHVRRVVAFEEIPSALRDLTERRTLGRIVTRIS
jgi:NADPH:quinone reductase-like Zn-dependent oxidoreductase